MLTEQSGGKQEWFPLFDSSVAGWSWVRMSPFSRGPAGQDIAFPLWVQRDVTHNWNSAAAGRALGIRWNHDPLVTSPPWQSQGLIPVFSPEMDWAEVAASWADLACGRRAQLHGAMLLILCCAICTFAKVGFLWLMGEVRVISHQTSPSALHLASCFYTGANIQTSLTQIPDT